MPTQAETRRLLKKAFGREADHIRLLQRTRDQWLLPLVDLGFVVGYHPRTLHHKVRNNAETFGGETFLFYEDDKGTPHVSRETRRGDVAQRGREAQLRCITPGAALGLVLMLSAERITDKGRIKNLVVLQRRIMNVLARGVQ